MGSKRNEGVRRVIGLVQEYAITKELEVRGAWDIVEHEGLAAERLIVSRVIGKEDDVRTLAQETFGDPDEFHWSLRPSKVKVAGILAGRILDDLRVDQIRVLKIRFPKK